ncbi:hypothetical protein, partial [Aeromonas caviae]|uniref:hypothetical protein n=1 Tax=Aeromonas caviae TaxID=648 RepID=UPI002B482AF0
AVFSFLRRSLLWYGIIDQGQTMIIGQRSRFTGGKTERDTIKPLSAEIINGKIKTSLVLSGLVKSNKITT